MREELPKTWVYARLDQIADVIAGNPAPQGNEYFDEGKYNFVRVHDMGVNRNRTYIDKTRDLVNDKAVAKLRLFPSGSVLFTKSGASTLLNQRAILSKESYIVSHIAAAIPVDGIESKWVFYFLNLVDFATLAHATNMPSLPISRAKSIEVPLAPEAEQRRIVSKIEELFSELDKGVECLEKAQEQLKVLRQAVLKHTFEGKLTERWREENKDKLEEPRKLLARIKCQIEARYKQQIKEWKIEVRKWKNSGKQGTKPKCPLKPKVLEPLSSANLANLPSLPFSWLWVRLGSISLVGTGVTPLKSNLKYYSGGDVPWVTSGMLNESYIRHCSNYVTDKALNETNLRLYPPHTLVVALYGEGKTRGKCSELLIHATTNQAVAAIIQEGSASGLRGFLKWFLTHNYEVMRLKSSGGVQPNLNLGIIENTAVPLCSVTEAKEIERRIERQLSTLAYIESVVESEIRKSVILRQSVLKQAFSGKLVAQQQNDEPASVLLARIHAANNAGKQSTQV